MRLDEELGIVVEHLVYTQTYAPEYPAEDQTDLDSEFSSMLLGLRSCRSATRSGSRASWLDFAIREVEKAFDSYQSGDVPAGRRSLESAETSLQNAQTGRRLAATFEVSSTGEVVEPDDEVGRTG